MAVPKLRFRADDGSEFPEWKEKTLGEITQKVVRKADDKSMADVRMISQGNGFILQSKKYSRENAGKSLKKYTLLKKNEFAYNHGASKVKPYGVCYRLIESDETRVPYVYHTFRLKNGNEDYWNYALNTSEMDKQLKKMVSSGVRMDGLLNINYETYMSVKVLIPSLPEQRKIADLLSVINDAITAQKAEVAAWEKRKKGVMQKLFSHEVRFKADDGSDFPDWEEKTLGDICMYERQRSEGTNFVGTENMLKDFGGVTFDNSNADGSGTLYHPGDTLMSNIRPYLKKAWLADRKGTCSTDVLVFHPTSIEPGYLYWLIVSDAFVRYVMSAAKGLKMPRGDKKHIMEMPLLLPNKDEQRKIDDCLSSLNNVIIKAKNELAKWQELKKGLLQQMFV